MLVASADQSNAKPVTPAAALRLAVERVGGQTAMARLVGVAQPSVWKWLRNGKELPPEHVLAVEEATGVSRHDLRPDIYPHEAPPEPGDAGPMEPAR